MSQPYVLGGITYPISVYSADDVWLAHLDPVVGLRPDGTYHVQRGANRVLTSKDNHECVICGSTIRRRERHVYAKRRVPPIGWTENRFCLKCVILRPDYNVPAIGVSGDE